MRPEGETSLVPEPRFGVAVALVVLVTVAVSSPGAHAREVTGVEIAERASVEGVSLVLNGAGRRSKFFVTVYVGALYLPRAAATPEEVLALPAPKRVRMRFVHDEVSAERIRDGWRDAFRANHDAPTLERLAARIEAFNDLFPTLREGDVVDLDLLAGGATRVSVNAEVHGRIDGADFQDAVLRIWLGPQPADAGLKGDMLGR